VVMGFSSLLKDASSMHAAAFKSKDLAGGAADILCTAGKLYI
jgi:hypothetical protein